MQRPYLSLPIEELEALFEQRWHDLGTLRLLAEELANRQTDRALGLQMRVRAELARRSPEEEPQPDLLGRDALDCPFCSLPADRVAKSGECFVAFADAYPVAPGHTLLAPRRHVASFFDTTSDERAELLFLLDWCRQDLLARYRATGFNIGINDGRSAGQTVMHLHVHLIPRYDGDKRDPRGGVRWIFPEKADYWSAK